MFPIAKNTFLDIFRSHFLLVIMAINIVCILILLLFNALSLGESGRIFYDMGLSFLELSHLCLLLFLGHQLLSKEVEQRTLYLLFVRPISRYNIILGKFLGFSFALLISFFVQLLMIICLFFIFDLPVLQSFLMASATIFLTVEVLLAVLLLMSVLLPQSLIIFATLAIYIIGNSSYSLLEYAIQNNNSILEYVAKFLVVVFPNFGAINIKNTVNTPIVVDVGVLGISITGMIIYLIVVLIVTCLLFSRRNFDNV